MLRSFEMIEQTRDERLAAQRVCGYGIGDLAGTREGRRLQGGFAGRGRGWLRSRDILGRLGNLLRNFRLRRILRRLVGSFGRGRRLAVGAAVEQRVGGRLHQRRIERAARPAVALGEFVERGQ